MFRQKYLRMRGHAQQHLDKLIGVGAERVSIGELTDCDYSPYPNVQRWIGNMKKLKAWSKVNEVFDGFVARNQGKKFVRL